MLIRPLRDALILAAVVFVTTGCASLPTGPARTGAATTRIATFGPLIEGGSLLTLVVTEDLNLVRRECAGVGAKGQILGCHIARSVPRDGGSTIRAMKIVRYAESAPTPATFEIDAHELCHAVAALQSIKDPCHEGNGGVLQAQEGVGVAIQRPTR